jgi:hypothetical protein
MCSWINILKSLRFLLLQALKNSAHTQNLDRAEFCRCLGKFGGNQFELQIQTQPNPPNFSKFRRILKPCLLLDAAINPNYNLNSIFSYNNTISFNLSLRKLKAIHICGCSNCTPQVVRLDSLTHSHLTQPYRDWLISRQIPNRYAKYKPCPWSNQISRRSCSDREGGDGEWFGKLTAVSDEKQLDEVVVVGPSPRRRRRHPALPPNP